MVDTCHVTGVVISPDGDPVPRATVRFQRLPHEVFVEEDRTGIPREVRAEADQDGAIAVDLIPGEYKTLIIARGYNQYPAFNVGVPDQPTAVLADIQDVPPPPSLDDAERAVRDARDARDEAGNYASAASDSAQAAQTAEQSAQGHAQAAADSAQAAASSAQAAATSEQNAATSEGNASGSAQAASQSASAAATSEGNASDSAQAAAGSASAASTSESNADDARQAAEAAAQAATEKAEEAADSAQNAADAAAKIPDATGASAGSLIEADGNGGYLLKATADHIARLNARAGFHPKVYPVYDYPDQRVLTNTSAYAMTTSSGHEWEPVTGADPDDTGDPPTPNLYYRASDGVLREAGSSNAYADNVNYPLGFSLLKGIVFRNEPRSFRDVIIGGLFNLDGPNNWTGGVCCGFIDVHNYLFVSIHNVGRIYEVVDGEVNILANPIFNLFDDFLHFHSHYTQEGWIVTISNRSNAGFRTVVTPNEKFRNADLRLGFAALSSLNCYGFYAGSAL